MKADTEICFQKKNLLINFVAIKCFWEILKGFEDYICELFFLTFPCTHTQNAHTKIITQPFKFVLYLKATHV